MSLITSLSTTAVRSRRLPRLSALAYFWIAMVLLGAAAIGSAIAGSYYLNTSPIETPYVGP